jgi:hypothetical protein
LDQDRIVGVCGWRLGVDHWFVIIVVTNSASALQRSEAGVSI